MLIEIMTTVVGMIRHRLAGALVLVLALAACGGEDEPPPEPGGDAKTASSATPTTMPRTAEGTPGETIAAGPYTFTVHEITDPWERDDELGTPEGERDVVVDITIANMSDAPLESSSTCFKAVDADSRQHKPTLGIGDHEEPDGTIAPGDELRGDVGFRVPDDVELVELNLKSLCNGMDRFPQLIVTLDTDVEGGPSTTVAPTATEAPQAAAENDPDDVDARLVEVATKIGCSAPNLEPPAPNDVGIDQYATCDREGTRVQLYTVIDREAMAEAVAVYDVDLDTTSVFVGDDVMVTPDDTTQLTAIAAALE